MKTIAQVKKELLTNLESMVDAFIDDLEVDDTRLKDDDWNWVEAFLESGV